MTSTNPSKARLKLTIISQMLLIVIVTISCIGQERKNTDRNINTLSKHNDSTTSDSSVNNQNFGDFPLQPGIANEISEVVRKVFQDRKGNIWFGSQDGAFYYDGKSLKHLDSIKSESGQGVTIKDIAEDKDGNIWFGHTDGISKFDGETITNYYEIDGLINNDVWCIAVDNDNTIWIGTIDGACKFNGTRFEPFNLPEGKPDPTRGVTSSKMIHDIMVDNQDKIWFSTNAGVITYDGKKLGHISKTDGLATNFINEVLEDKTGTNWISTQKGLYQLNGKNLINITDTIIEPEKGTGSVIQDTKGTIWFNSNLRDIYSFNGKDFTKYKIPQRDYGHATFQIYEDQQNRLWFAGFGGVERYENGKFIAITKNGPW